MALSLVGTNISLGDSRHGSERIDLNHALVVYRDFAQQTTNPANFTAQILDLSGGTIVLGTKATSTLGGFVNGVSIGFFPGTIYGVIVFVRANAGNMDVFARVIETNTTTDTVTFGAESTGLVLGETSDSKINVIGLTSTKAIIIEGSWYCVLTRSGTSITVEDGTAGSFSIPDLQNMISAHFHSATEVLLTIQLLTGSTINLGMCTISGTSASVGSLTLLGSPPNIASFLPNNYASLSFSSSEAVVFACDAGLNGDIVAWQTDIPFSPGSGVTKTDHTSATVFKINQTTALLGSSSTLVGSDTVKSSILTVDHGLQTVSFGADLNLGSGSTAFANDVMVMGSDFGLIFMDLNTDYLVQQITGPELALPSGGAELRYLGLLPETEGGLLYATVNEGEVLKLFIYDLDNLPASPTVTLFSAATFAETTARTKGLFPVDFPDRAGVFFIRGNDGNSQQVLISTDSGATFTDVSAAPWVGVDYVVGLVINSIEPLDIVAVLDINDIYQSIGEPINWVKVADATTSQREIARGFTRQTELLLGSKSPDTIEFTNNLGLTVVDISDTFGAINKITESL